MKPLPHQITYSRKLWDILVKNKYAYLSALPRAGKSATVLLTLEYSKRIKNVLILTPLNAITGWTKFIDDEEFKSNLTKNYTVTNYEQIGGYKLRTHSKSGKKLKNPKRELALKLNPDDYDVVVFDEAHRLGKLGKPTQRYLMAKELTQDKPIICLSGTAIVESPNSIYYQMSTSTNTPFPHKSFYEFFKDYGIPSSLRLGGREIAKYNLAQPKLLEYIDTFTVYMTQEDAGISKEVQATDHVHYIDLLPSTRLFYNKLLKTGCESVHSNMLTTAYTVDTPTHMLVCDSTMKSRTSLHMLEGGVLKIDDDTTIFTGNLEKINYIKETWGDHNKLGIMSHFIGERKLLEQHFKHANIYSSTRHAEGVDLSHLTDFIIYSSGYSGAKAAQRRERTVNVNNTEQSIVHHLVVKGAISEQVYETTSKKIDFNNSTFKKRNI